MIPPVRFGDCPVPKSVELLFYDVRIVFFGSNTAKISATRGTAFPEGRDGRLSGSLAKKWLVFSNSTTLWLRNLLNSRAIGNVA
jgi:hypothetical protein